MPHNDFISSSNGDIQSIDASSYQRWIHYLVLILVLLIDNFCVPHPPCSTTLLQCLIQTRCLVFYLFWWHLEWNFYKPTYWSYSLVDLHRVSQLVTLPRLQFKYLSSSSSHDHPHSHLGRILIERFTTTFNLNSCCCWHFFWYLSLLVFNNIIITFSQYYYYYSSCVEIIIQYHNTDHCLFLVLTATLYATGVWWYRYNVFWASPFISGSLAIADGTCGVGWTWCVAAILCCRQFHGLRPWFWTVCCVGCAQNWV